MANKVIDFLKRLFKSKELIHTPYFIKTPHKIVEEEFKMTINEAYLNEEAIENLHENIKSELKIQIADRIVGQINIDAADLIVKDKKQKIVEFKTKFLYLKEI